MLTVPAEVLFELERELGEPRFIGVPIGSTLGALFHLDLFLGLGRWDPIAICTDRLRFLYHYSCGIRYSGQKAIEPLGKTGRILVTLPSDHPHIRDLMVPVLERLGSNASIVLSRDESIASQFVNFDVVTLDSLGYNRRLWRREFRKRFPIWRMRLRKVLEKYELPFYIMPRLYNAMVVQSQRVLAYHSLLGTLDSRAVVTDYDRGYLFSSLILAAKARYIPTMTMQHGVINPPYGYVPLLADLAFCWGQQSFDQMVEMGTEPKRLKVVGCQRQSPKLSADRNLGRQRLNVMDDRPLILLASNPINVVDRKLFVRQFCEALAGQEQFSIAVRLHPSEKMQFYAQETHDFPKVTFSSAGQMTVDEALAAADIVVSRSSGFGNDALLKGEIVVIFDVINAPLGNAQGLIERAGCPHVKSGEELRNVIMRIVSDTEFQNKIRHKAQDFIRYQFAAFSNEATDNIMNVMENLNTSSFKSETE